MNESITEEKAREILDFLAKKYGYINGFEKITSSEMTDKESTLSLINCVVVDGAYPKVDSLDFLLSKADRDRNCKSVLEFMLDIASAGFNIGAFCHKYGDYLLKAHTTLEEIFIEMDLNKI